MGTLGLGWFSKGCSGLLNESLALTASDKTPRGRVRRRHGKNAPSRRTVGPRGTLLPKEPPKPKGGRPPVDDRAVLTGILFVLKRPPARGEAHGGRPQRLEGARRYGGHHRTDSATPRGRPRKRPQKLHADKAYDAKKCREVLRKRGIKARIARRGKESSEKLGRYRWVVERTLSWLNRYRRLNVRYERRADI